MEQVTTIGLDIAKHVFHAHGAAERGAKVFSKHLTLAHQMPWGGVHPITRSGPCSA